MWKSLSVDEIIADEVLIIETSGEMPVVAYHGSIYYLTFDPEGPRLFLADEYSLKLKKAVIEGFRRIIARDLALENRDKGLYRGMARCAVNWERLDNFCQAEGLGIDDVASEVCESLIMFLLGELEDVRQGRQTSINCSRDSLFALAVKVGLDPLKLPPGLGALTMG